jgi:catechol 2,3-dioxygenase-like lactoylglutathione lyase family enzyme
MRIYVTSIFVDDQAKALDFYTNVLGFVAKHDIPVGEHRWLTVVPAEAPLGTELLLEPNEHPAVKPYQTALAEDGIPAASFQVDDLDGEVEKLRARGVVFSVNPMDVGAVRMAIFDDTCGNLIQLVELKEQ